MLALKLLLDLDRADKSWFFRGGFVPLTIGLTLDLEEIFCSCVCK